MRELIQWFPLAVLSLCGGAAVAAVSDAWTADGVPVTLPHTWNAQDAADGEGLAPDWAEKGYSAGSLSYVRKAVTYQRELPDPKPGKRYFVKCGGASIKTTVKVNGREIGRHVGSFTGFCFEMTEAMKPSGNVLEFVVDNRFDPDVQPIHADFSVYGGLYRVPEILERDAVCVDPRRTPVVRADPKTGRVEIDYWVSSASQTIKQSETQTIPSLELWSPENPKLYPVTIREGADERTLLVGFRTMEFREDGFYLNGVKRKLRGVCRHQDRAGKGWGASVADEEEDVRWMKRMGADAVRTAHYPQSETFLGLCDRYGLVVWEELPNVNGLTFTAAAEANERTMAREMLEQHRNHPCIFAWGLYNELYNMEMSEKPEPRIAALADYVRQLDPTRPTVAASCFTAKTELHATTDQLGFNLYPGWYGNPSATMRERLDAAFARNPARTTAAVSEYGAGAGTHQHGDAKERPADIKGSYHPMEYQAYWHWKQYPAIKDDPRVWGSFVWVMFDLASDAKREGERFGLNDKGLVSWDRSVAKDAFYFYKANWNPEPMLHLVGKGWTETSCRTATVLAFANVGVVTLRVNGRIVGTKEPDGVKGVCWEDVPLAFGDNEIEVVAGNFRETAHWRRTPPAFPTVGKVRALTHGPKDHFLASYFAINSWSPDLRYVLALETDVNGRLSKAGETCTIGVVDTQDGNRFIPVSETRAWNFQEAAMGHWLPNEKDTILFNDCRDGRFVTVVMNWKTKAGRLIPHPVSAVSPDGTKAISLNYARIRLTRPDYGYAGPGQDPLVGEPWPEKDGLWLVDLKTGAAKLIVPVSAVRGQVPEVGPKGLFYFCHTVFSRDGKRLFWLARGIDWYDPVNEKAGDWTTTAFTCDADGGNIRRCFPGRDWGGSHFNWLDGETMVVTVYPKEVDPQAWHVKFTVGKEEEPRRLAPRLMDFDGHCVWSPDGNWISSEGYFDKTFHRNWVLMRAADEACLPVGSFFVPEAYRGKFWRCDLHARWRPDGRQLGFNSVHEGSRQIYVLDLKQERE